MGVVPNGILQTSEVHHLLSFGGRSHIFCVGARYGLFETSIVGNSDDKTIFDEKKILRRDHTDPAATSRQLCVSLKLMNCINVIGCVCCLSRS